MKPSGFYVDPVFESRLRGLFLRENTIKEKRQLIVLDKLPFFLSG